MTPLNRIFEILEGLFPRRKLPQTALVGRAGEDAAARFLKKSGYKILARNFRSGRNEIDIVCAKDGVLVFAEVKTRSASARVGGYFAGVQSGKKARVRACAAAYMRRFGRPKTWRFDVVEVAHTDGGNFEPHHYQNVY